MANHDDANLILKLYELRREDKLRAAREWFAGKFRPQSAQDMIDTINGEHSAYLELGARYELTDGDLDAETLTLAEELEAAHRPSSP